MTDVKDRAVDIVTTAPRKVTIDLGVERHLLYDLNALEELENIYGDLDTALSALSKDKKRIKHIKNFIFAGLRHEDKSLTPEMIGKMIGFSGLTAITDQIWQAFTQSMPDPKEGRSQPGGIGGPLPWTKMLYFVCVKLGFSESEFWSMTLRKYIALRDEYIDENTPEQEKDAFADDIL